jgi:choline dehydrogenase-like flavoprotein
VIYDLDNGAQLNSNRIYDLLVVGTGPAAMTILKELLNTNLKICVLESGSKKACDFTDSLKTAYSDKLKIKSNSRERVLGGTSTTWQGLSSPFDDISLEKRDWLAHDIGWPIARSELNSYYSRAAAGYRFPPLHLFNTDSDTKWNELRELGEIRPEWTDLQEKIFIQTNPIQNFSNEFPEVFVSPNIDFFLNASLKKFIVAKKLQRQTITNAVVMNSQGATFECQAKAYVLCAGAIETPRILLNSPDTDGVALGNANGQVGCYMMNHPKRWQGVITLNKPLKKLPYFFGYVWQGFSGYAGVRLTDKIQKEKQLVNGYIRLEPIFSWSDNQGIEAFLQLAKGARTLLKAWSKIKKKSVIQLQSFAETGDNSLNDIARPTLISLIKKIVVNFNVVCQYILFRVFKTPIVNKIRLCIFMEMEPAINNRVLLSEQMDSHGYRLPLVSYAPTQKDKESIIELTNQFASEFMRGNYGAFTEYFSIDGEFYESINSHTGFDASHHIGTTRMGLDANTSVVDSTQKLHSSDNLFISGSSVFPNSCIGNPTYTIVALSIRLAEHLRTRFAS